MQRGRSQIFFNFQKTTCHRTQTIIKQTTGLCNSAAQLMELSNFYFNFDCPDNNKRHIGESRDVKLLLIMFGGHSILSSAYRQAVPLTSSFTQVLVEVH